MVNAIVLAGSSKTGELEEQQGVNNKAFILINNEPMISIILKTLQRVEGLDKIVVVGPVDELKGLQDQNNRFEIVEQQDTFLKNITIGLQSVDIDTPCIVLSADIPMITKEAIEGFIAMCSPEYDFYYPIINRELCEKSFPEVKRTYFRLKEGSFTGGNILMITPSCILDKIDDINVYLSYRKSLWKLVQTLPLSLIIKFITRRLPIQDLETYVKGLFEIKAKTVISPYVEIGVDIDKPSDLVLARKVLSSKD